MHFPIVILNSKSLTSMFHPEANTKTVLTQRRNSWTAVCEASQDHVTSALRAHHVSVQAHPIAHHVPLPQ